MKFRKSLVFLVALVLSAVVLAHPHFSKTVTAQLGGNEIRLSFTTYPYSSDHLNQVSNGFVFHCGRATLELTQAMGTTLPAGKYLVRARAASVDDWTLYLIPEAETTNNSAADVSKGIALKSSTLTDLPSSHHLDVDLYSGHGPTEGNLVLAVAFGERKVEGVLTMN